MAAETINPEKDDVVPHFEIDGTDYELPQWPDFDLDEWSIAYKYADVVLSDFSPQEDEEAETARMKKLTSPLFTAALVHIAFHRAYPKKTYAAIEKDVGRIKMIPLLEQLTDDLGEEEENPTSVTKPEPSSKNDSDEAPKRSSTSSETSSETPDAPLATIGTSG